MRRRTAMRKIKEVLRLCLGEGLSARQASHALGVPRVTINRYLTHATVAGVGWAAAEAMDDAELERKLFRPPGFVEMGPPRPLPDFAELHKELRRKGMTLQLAWMEYRERHRDGYQYSQFCEHYRRWQKGIDVVMRQEHRAGDKVFVDFAGVTLPIHDPRTGEITQAQLFVAVLGASNYTYAEACLSQEMPHWIAAHVHAFESFGAVPAACVCDNLKAGVIHPHRYEPDINRSYLELARHYRCVILPARRGKPRDKAKVEAGVLLAERWILAALRNRKFFSLAEANAAIRELLVRLNERDFQKLPGSRRSTFLEIDLPAMRQLPAQPYEYGEWRTSGVNIDYHIDVDHHFYSVPYQLARQRVDVRISATVIEVFKGGRRVASHVRSRKRGFTTVDAHMPESHQRHREWTPSRIVGWASRTGPATADLVDTIMRSRPHPEQGFRSCLGIMRLGQRYGDDRLEAASERAVAIQAHSYKSIESILRAGLDRQPLTPRTTTTTTPEHDNVRGPAYYQ